MFDLILLQKKIDNRKKTGSGGGPDCKLTDVDKAVVDIIGRQTPVLVGLDCTETWQDGPCEESALSNEDTCVVQSSEITVTPNVITPKQKSSSKNVVKKSPADIEHDEKMVRAKKLKLSVELLEKENYLKTLQILKLERELGIPASSFTKDLPIEIPTLFVNYNGALSQNSFVNEVTIEEDVASIVKR